MFRKLKKGTLREHLHAQLLPQHARAVLHGRRDALVGEQHLVQRSE
jgi:hypothetical protein